MNSTRTQGRLPRSIAPHQPLVDLATLRLVTRDQNALDLAFQGDTFEMEDQRNWLDPSYKLYSRALSLPVPYRVADGERIEQCVRIVPALTADAAGEATSPASPGHRASTWHRDYSGSRSATAAGHSRGR